MKRQIVSMIEQARRPGSGIGLDDQRDTASRLASEAIRLARLAASTHMILAARSIAQDQAAPAPPVRKAAS